MEGSSADGSLSFQLGHVNLSPFPGFSSSADSPLRFEKILEAEGVEDVPVADVEEEGEDRDRILSQDFFCTPDYITPDAQQIDNGFQFDKSGSTQENIPCPKSPEKTTNSRNKRHKSVSIGGDGLSRYHTDFHEIEQIGYGNFSNVFKVLKRIDGCLYAVKQSNKQLHHDMERRSALMEVQALAVLGSHENVVGYYTSWFENERLYIQMELCDRSLSISPGQNIKREEAFKIIYQMAKALHFMHEKGIAHLDVKPENIYFKEGIYKLGDFGCATLIDKSLCVEEGDSRYMPPEMLNDKYEHLDKVDIFSLGASVYELVKGSPLPDSGPQFSNLREGKIPLLPGYTIQFQTLLKAMMDPDPLKRPSAKEILEHPTFEKPKVSLKHSSSRQSCSRLTKLR
ncbi:wee1-like protein kinase isoform X5 [Zingiber officinale]|uniref:wee1-like protein kinase isoform X5 n=1 Tax=Zingiber officinale TaxID=94328 RepID=UPI001C4B197B|nr:wee1-like protein kinase isoform X5 [Zingiber officinale]